MQFQLFVIHGLFSYHDEWHLPILGLTAGWCRLQRRMHRRRLLFHFASQSPAAAGHWWCRRAARRRRCCGWKSCSRPSEPQNTEETLPSHLLFSIQLSSPTVSDHDGFYPSLHLYNLLGVYITTPYAPRSSRFGSEPPSVEDDVDVWCYARELHARNDDDIHGFPEKYDWPLTWLTKHHPSVLWCCWFGRLTRQSSLKWPMCRVGC